MTPFSLNINGNLIQFTRPQVMGILNVTPDSFYTDSRAESHDSVKARVRKMIDEGVDIIDVGAYSTRPGYQDVSPQEEMRRLEVGFKALREVAPDIITSVDTFRADVAEYAINELSANIINDISGGKGDERMFQTVKRMQVPYILNHMGNNQNLDDDTLVPTVMREIAQSGYELLSMGVNDLILDPGFGFGKSLEQNYQLLNNLNLFTIMHLPVLVGVSRKSMVTRLLNTTPEDALIGTTSINTVALQRGASILRVHDVVPAVQAVKIYTQLSQFSPSGHD